jgi:hypothetical protein
MPTVLRIGAYRLYFFSHEPNEPAHVHVDRGSSTIKVWLKTEEFVGNRGFRPHEINAILKMVDEHREALLEAWYEYFGPDRR